MAQGGEEAAGGGSAPFRRRMKHSRRLKVNIFPFPSSSRSEGASQGYQLGSGTGGKAVRAWGLRDTQGQPPLSTVGLLGQLIRALPRPGKGHRHIHGHGNTERGS